MKNFDEGYFEGGIHKVQSKKNLDRNKGKQRREDDRSLKRYVTQNYFQAKELEAKEEPLYRP